MDHETSNVDPASSSVTGPRPSNKQRYAYYRNITLSLTHIKLLQFHRLLKTLRREYLLQIHKQFTVYSQLSQTSRKRFKACVLRLVTLTGHVN